MTLHARTLLSLIALVATLAAGGCGNDQPTSGEPADRVTSVNAIDGAYETVIAEQNDNAVAYSEAIKKMSTVEPGVAEFADSVIEERAKEAEILERVTRGNSETSPADAADALGIPLRELAISADGEPLVAPGDVRGYLKAMRANVEGALAATKVQLDDGGPGTSQLANRVKLYRDAELAQLDELSK